MKVSVVGKYRGKNEQIYLKKIVGYSINYP